MADPRPEDVQPPAGGVLAEFLAASRESLYGRLDGGGAVLEANPALRRWLDAGPTPALAGALLPGSALRWHEALATLDRPGRHLALDLDLGRDRPGPVTYRCLVQRDERGLWLFGERAGGSAERQAARLLVKLTGLSRRLYHRVVELEGACADVEVQARTDPLTGLANRRQSDAWLRAMIALAEAERAPLACVLADLDDFKSINDTFGHPAGDAVLREAARVLAESIRPSDRVARLGGEEFLILLPGTDPAGAVAVADRLRRALSDRVIPPLECGLGASFGVAGARPGESADDLVRRADAALLRAKRTGRGRIEREP